MWEQITNHFLKETLMKTNDMDMKLDILARLQRKDIKRFFVVDAWKEEIHRLKDLLELEHKPDEDGYVVLGRMKDELRDTNHVRIQIPESSELNYILNCLDRIKTEIIREYRER